MPIARFRLKPGHECARDAAQCAPWPLITWGTLRNKISKSKRSDQRSMYSMSILEGRAACQQPVRRGKQQFDPFELIPNTSVASITELGQRKPAIGTGMGWLTGW